MFPKVASRMRSFPISVSRGQKTSICESPSPNETALSHLRRHFPRSDFKKQVSLSILLIYRRFLSTTSRFSRRRPRDGARLPGARLHPCRENRRPGQMAGRPLATFQFKGVAARPIVHNPRKVTISPRFRAADATAARLLLRNWGTEKAVAGLASRKE